MTPRLWCWLIGHDWSWSDAFSMGFFNAAVCRRCHLVNPTTKKVR